MRLQEKNRQDLINKSKNADVTKTYGTTRYDRRNAVHVYNTTAYLNKIDMNALFRADLLSFIIPVHGETDNYEIEVLFEGVMTAIQEQVKLNNDICEYKCIYRAIINAVNRQDLYVACSCEDWKYRMAYHATKGRYNSGRSQLVPARVTNPNDSKGAGCKHVMKILADLDWALKLATTINNYIIYMENHMPEKFQDVMFPIIHGRPYDPEVDGDLANSMDNEDDIDVIDDANENPIDDEEEFEDEEEGTLDGD